MDLESEFGSVIAMLHWRRWRGKGVMDPDETHPFKLATFFAYLAEKGMTNTVMTARMCFMCIIDVGVWRMKIPSASGVA